MSEEKLNLLLAHSGHHMLELWACRGQGKGCKRNRYRAIHPLVLIVSVHYRTR